MGYYTRFTLTIERFVNNSIADIEELINKRIQEISGYSRICIDEITDDMKWYDFDSNMITLSKEFPNLLFKLKGEGEESTDIWENYYCNGKSLDSVTKITFEYKIPPIKFFENETADYVFNEKHGIKPVYTISEAQYNAAMILMDKFPELSNVVDKYKSERKM